MKHLGFFSGIVVALLLIGAIVWFWSEGGRRAKIETVLVQDVPRAGGERGGPRGERGERGGQQQRGAANQQQRGGPANAQQQRGGPGGAERGGPGGGAAGLATLLTRAQGQGQFNDLIELLAELNLEPTFELSRPQKENLKQIREGYKAATESWRKQAEPEVQKLIEQAAQIQADGNRDAWRGINEKRQAILASAPSGEQAAQQVRELLTPEQLSAVDEQLKVRRGENDERRRQIEERLRGARQAEQQQEQPQRPARGGDARPAPAPAAPQAPAPEPAQ